MSSQEITLERFKNNRAGEFFQALRISHLVGEEAAWLREAYPGIVDDFETPHNAIENIDKVLALPDALGYVVKRGHTAVGMASLIFRQQVIHREGGAYEGTYLDYWLKRGIGVEAHRMTAAALVRQAYRLHDAEVTYVPEDNSRLSQGVVRVERPFSAIAIVGQYNDSALGFQSVMSPVGGAARLTMLGEDPYNITRDQGLVQLYERGNDEVRRRVEVPAERPW